MPRYFVEKLHAFLFAVLVFLGVMFGSADAVQAGKAVKSIVFDPASPAVNVAAIYETTPETQKDVVSSIMQSNKFFKDTPGFESFSVLQSEDGARVITLTQWKDADSYEAYAAQPLELCPSPPSAIVGPPSSKSAVRTSTKSSTKKTVATPARTVVFEVDKTQTPEGMLPALRGKYALVQFDEITAKSADDVTELLAAAEDSLADVTKLYPSPRTAVLFKGVDNADVAVLTNWGYAEEFTDVTKLPALEVLPEDVDALASHDDHFYEVVKIISAKPDSKAKEKT
ncbi:antibiotic biosynthesis monooxygenase [Leptolyngbya sp. 7M]|uniref:antibiotic biosynthesis monooxygenase n=1 Tax=Leptolyngbya sp. 7M TaxID=2812896 RepID=UPI001B8BDE61|nr:antibiotic biosynthesis monooxygenase [Leptolyngbya sp. 7M]QYO63834.1 antibiotic biosynthesis monooxygenase [Leptolyngbya sp. 7M]